MKSIDLSTYTPEQIRALRSDLRKQGKQSRGSVDARWAVVDPMLQERNDDGFLHTTADILTRLQSESVAPAELSDENRRWWLKVIQTRKQRLEKLVKDGALVHPVGSIGFRASATGFVLSVDRVVAWLAEQDDAARAAVRAAC